MGTNYYRIPQTSEMDERKYKLLERVANLELTPSNIERGFNVLPIDNSKYDWETNSPWNEFIEGTNIHLGKRSSGWKFCWNFHKNKHYSNKDELLIFIRSGRVVDEYGDEQDVEEFITMALEWGEPDGLVVNEEYRRKQRTSGMGSFFDKAEYDDLIIDGLRVSTATEFC